MKIRVNSYKYPTDLRAIGGRATFSAFCQGEFSAQCVDSAGGGGIVKAHIEEIQTATEDERLVHRFLEEAARPHGDYDFWYEPQLDPSCLSPAALIL